MEYIISNAISTTGEPLEVLVRDGVILEVAKKIAHEGPGASILDADGLTLAPALIDAHVHLRDPGQTHKEDIESGTNAAASGGVGTVLCMPNTSPVIDSSEVIRYILDKAASCRARVLPVAAVTAGLEGEILTDFEALLSAGAVAFSDDGRPVMDDGLMRRALIEAKRVGRPLISHCEHFGYTAAATARDFGFDSDLPVTCSESAMAARDLALCLELDAPLHIAHVSTAATAAILREAKRRGARVTAETCPHYMLLTSDAVATHGANARMNPPLASEADLEAVTGAVCDGTIDIIVTDHAPHTAAEKASDTPPNGIIGLETLLCGALTALVPHLPLDIIIDKMTAAPAKIYGLDTGVLRVGAPADLLLFDPHVRRRADASHLYSKSKNTPFDGFEFIGRAKATIVGGDVKYRR